MKRLLIVCPQFAPINAADMHRTRISLPFYRQFGWEPLVLAVSPTVQSGVCEPRLLETIPRDISLTYVDAVSASRARRVGLGNVAWRASRQLFRAGLDLIRGQSVDLVLFSTTLFATMALGPMWKHRTGVSYAIDLQDPWVPEPTKATGFAGFKARLDRRVHRAIEPLAMNRVDGVMAVSKPYLDDVCSRFPHVRTVPTSTIPFGAAALDASLATAGGAVARWLDPVTANLRGVAVGRGGADMALAARILFRACRLARARSGFEAGLLFVGTDYAPRGLGRPSLEPVAAAEAMGGWVREVTDRVPYFDALGLLQDADFTVVLGSDDPRYSPSKVFPYLMAGRPLVAVVHARSPVVPLLREAALGPVVVFESATDIETAVDDLARRLPTMRLRDRRAMDLPASLARAISAETMTARQCAFFDAIMATRDGGAVA